ncbi:PREDICTED: uncharacterized protein LOC105576657 [Cercocebus atys]|uniref:uncharacterized protein LOC105576657 n=1 Tax=Cercocebus atys TaxID=9531 RepID=UPI0005F56682|nr:PREDICTED: uncharacterized protein LOC105576657 [Cercocebus atys]
MLCPGKPGERWARALGTRGSERASERACRLGDQSGPGQPAQSVSAAAGARPGPARTILTADLPPARAPATLLGAAGTRGPFRQGAEPVAVARSWRGRLRPLLTRNGSHTALREEAGRLGYGALGSRGAARAPPSSRLSFFRSCWACAAFLRREETLPSQLCDIRLHSRADVSRWESSRAPEQCLRTYYRSFDISTRLHFRKRL